MLNNTSFRHKKEWLASKVAEEIINLNVATLSYQDAWAAILYADEVLQKNRRAPYAVYRRRYKHLDDGGWWASTLDLLSEDCNTESLWGVLKPNNPRPDPNKPHKKIKCEHPVKKPTELFAFRVPLRIWKKISQRCGVPMPETIIETENGEALGFWKWVRDNPEVPIVITEGPKKAGAGLTAGYATVGLPGIYGGYRKTEYLKKPHELIPHLAILAVPGRQFIIAFDQDIKPRTRRNVGIAAYRLGRLLHKKGSSVLIASWEISEDTKGLDDLIATRGEQAFHRSYQKALPLPEYVVKHKIDKLHNLSLYNPTKIHEKYLTKENCPIDPEAQLVLIVGEKGVGKTSRVKSHILDLQRDGGQTICVTHRIQLAKVEAKEFGLTYILDKRKEEHPCLFGHTLCIDSLREDAQISFKASGWDLVFIDEVEKVIWHLLNSKTHVGKHRIEICNNIKKLIQTTIAEGGQIICADADLTPNTIEFLKEIANDIGLKTQIIVNTYSPYKEAKRKIIYYETTQPWPMLRKALELVRKGQKIMICVDGRKEKTEKSTKTIETWFQRHAPDKVIFNSDSETCSDPDHIAFGLINNLEALKECDILIASPVFSDGISIDFKHFDAVFCIAQGAMSVDSALQFLERVRDHVPRYIWARTAGLGKVGNGSHSFKELSLSEDKLTKYHIDSLRRIDVMTDEEYDDMEEFQPIFQKAWARMGAQKNFESTYYRKCIKYRLEKSGYEVITIKARKEEKKEEQIIKEQLRCCRDQNYTQWRELISQSPKISDQQYESLEQKEAKTKAERATERRHQLEKKYETEEVTPELVEQDDKGLYPQLLFQYYIGIGKAFLAARERKKVQAVKEQKQIFKPDFNRQFFTTKIDAWQGLKMDRFLDPTKTFTSKSLEKWQENLMPYRGDIQRVWGIRIDPEKHESPIQLVQRMLQKLLGLKLELVCRQGERGQEHRIYRGADPNANGRREILNRWLQRDHKNAADNGEF